MGGRLSPAGGVLALTVLLGACATPAKIPVVAEPDVKPVAGATVTKPIQLANVVVNLTRGQHIGAKETGILCRPYDGMRWRDGRINESDKEFAAAFVEELRKAKYPIVADTSLLFGDASASRAEVLVAGLVTDVKLNACYPYGRYGDYTTSSAEASITVEWQVYSQFDRKLIHTVRTTGTGKVPTRPDGENEVLYDAFAQATRGLLADQRFHDIVTTEATPAASAATLGAVLSRLVLKGARSSATPLAGRFPDAQAAVVTIFAGGAHGSGFVVTGDGYILTNEHVVEEARFVKVKFASGRELVGEVLRSDRRRDIALVKIGEPGNPHLPLRLGEPPVGSELYAVGTPTYEELYGSVTRGIVSAYRVLDGLPFLQSDVKISDLEYSHVQNEPDWAWTCRTQARLNGW